MKSNFDTSSLGSYHDLNSLQNLKGKSRESDQGKLEALNNIAKQFESMFVGMMLKSMRDANAAFEQDNPLNSSEMKFYRDMYDQQLSMHLSEGKGIGLADTLVRQISQQVPGLESLTQQGKGWEQLGMDHSGPGGQGKDMPGRDATFSPFENNNFFPTVKLDPKSGLPIKDQDILYAQPDSPQAKRIANAVKDYMDRQQISMYAQDEQALKVGVEHARSKQDRFDSPEEFVNVLWPVAQVAAKKLNADPKALLAQAALETGWGKKIPTHADGGNSFNLFGIKADSSWRGEAVNSDTTEFRNGIAREEKALFRSYGSYVESMLDYSSFLQSRSHYQTALNQAGDAEKYLNELQSAGYATDPKYANKIVRIMNSDMMKSL
ncbi:flagellar assembly peptidoglycan hydrolase FlgJ [Litoribacillus peritrichatus]|uniref:Peptidoglycan hydrolase FlgJ n=1 Tax=Litoribacillus peritrichatus TaxID=718191 RepID=A0ABP7M393_9GAMM